MRAIRVGALTAALLACAALAASYIVADPRVRVLLPAGDANWITLPPAEPLKAQSMNPALTTFRVVVRRVESARETRIHVSALGDFWVYMNGELLARVAFDPAAWKEERTIRLQVRADPINSLRVLVRSTGVTPALRVRSVDPAFRTAVDTAWRARNMLQAEAGWRQPQLADLRYQPALASRFPSPVHSLRSLLPWIVSCTAFGFVLCLALQRKPVSVPDRAYPWLIVAVFLALAMNSVAIGPSHGFDARAHLEYIRYIIEERSLPLAGEGWQMFQSPLYYLASAALYQLLQLTGGASPVILLKFIPALSGMVLAIVTFRVVVAALRADASMRWLVFLLVTGFPVNLYMSQYLGNEPLAAVFNAAAVGVVFGMLRGRETIASARSQVLLGVLLGLSLLTKVSAVVSLAVSICVLGLFHLRAGMGFGAMSAMLARVLLPVVLVSGWYYGRNWLELGSLFVGGWDPARVDLQWWQYPGYRTPADLYSFGRALAQPVLAVFGGFWDGLYATLWTDGYLGSAIEYEHAPPWNYEFLAAAVLLAMLPTLLIIAGAVRAVTVAEGAAAWIGVYCVLMIAAYLGAMLWLYVNVPVYSTVKASYTLGITPCWLYLCAYGAHWLAGRRMASASLCGLLSAWSVLSVAGFLA